MKLSVRFIEKRVISELTYQLFFFDLNKPSMTKMCIQAEAYSAVIINPLTPSND